MVVVDDYEFLEKVFDGFLLEELVPRLRNASFQTALVLIGRDELDNTSDALWAQPPLSDDLAGRQIVLSPLSRSEVQGICRSWGFIEETASKVYEETQGYPWLIDLVREDLTSEGKLPVTSYDKFFARMGRFMSDRQRRWFKALCYLDRITIESIKRVLEQENPDEVLEWFKHEASIRHTEAEYYTVWPFIRYRVLLSQWLDSPERFEALATKCGLPYDAKSGPMPQTA